MIQDRAHTCLIDDDQLANAKKMKGGEALQEYVIQKAFWPIPPTMPGPLGWQGFEKAGGS